MPSDHLRLVENPTDPPDLEDGDGDGDGDEEAVAVDLTILGSDWRQHTARLMLPAEEADPETIAFVLIQVARAAACIYSPDVQMALEHQLLKWGSPRG